ncbi:Inner membrane protein YnbA [Novipirellula aureliae]|uniref:Inner membrane protein YnbA n=1 Tax=Novipirellula aureliae TaxID=2527966 RepID=A0A5C6E4Q0_9BACT|nr:CDP-alcohol phosphatidyltransferase family protein [Novipirellula aureliae]TWU43888.1 Inner membrane protein YnbA [Novipirellula aureliae]
MASVYDLKPKFQDLLRPMVRRLAAAGTTANQVTIAALLLSVATGVCIGVWPSKPWPLLLIPIALLVRMALNAIDGMLAREFNQKSRLGAVLNELGDVLSDITLYLPLALVPSVNATAIVIFVISSIVVEFVGVVAIQIDRPRQYAGPMGKSDRAFWVGLLAVLLAFQWIRPPVTSFYLSALIFLAGWTVINRAWRSLVSHPSATTNLELETRTDDPH